MAIMYTKAARPNASVNDGFSQILHNTYDEFKAQDINIFGDGFQEVLRDDSYFSRYVDMLAEEFNTDDAENFKIMANNNREVALESASLGNIAPMSYLANPMLRKSWAKLAMPKALPTEAVEQPKFTITYLQPWIRNSDGKKLFVPEDLDKFGDAVSKIKLADGVAIAFTNGFASVNLLKGVTVDELGKDTGTNFDPNFATDGYKEAVAKVRANDEMDRDVVIRQVKFDDSAVIIYNGAAVAGKTLGSLKVDTVALTDADKTVDAKINMATRNNSFKDLVRLEIEVDNDGIDTTAGAPAKVTVEVIDTIFAEADLQSGRFTITSVGGKIASVTVDAYVSSVMNNYTTEVNFDVIDKEVHVATAPHISATVPNEYITDLLKMYSFSGVTKVVDIISNTLAQKLDLDGIKFIDETTDEFLTKSNGRFVRKFSAKPVGNTLIPPSEWRKEIRIVLDHLAQDLINHLHFEVGYFVILGNPLDTMLIPEVTWSFEGNGREMAGVPTQYATGTFRGAYNYNVVSSPNVPQGNLRMYFIPTAEDQMTMKFFPYSFTVEQPGNGYLNPNAQNVPGIIAHRRYAFEKILACQGRIVITNNSYREYSFAGTSSYLPTDTEV